MAVNTIKKASFFDFTYMSNVDLNSMIESGCFFVDGGTNYPAGTNGYLIVLNETSQVRVKQFFFRHGTLLTNSMEWYGRDIRKDGTSIGDWYKITNTKV